MTLRMDGFVLGRGPAGRCDDFRVGGCVVHHDAAAGVWRMYYYCRDRAFDRGAPRTLGSGRIALATSQDGMDWTRFDGPEALGSILAPTGQDGDFDSVHVACSDVTRDGDDLLLWYFGGDRDVTETGSALGALNGIAMRPGLARSRDGVNWRRQAGLATGGALIDIDPGCVYAAWPNIIAADGRRVMQYTAPAFGLADYRVMQAISEDGIGWTKQGQMRWADGDRPWDCTGVITRQVVENPLPGGQRWLMLYTGTDKDHARSICTAQSDDRLTWTHLDESPVFGVGGEGSWDSLGVAAMSLVAVGGRLHLYYLGFQSLADDDKPRGIGLAISETGRLSDLRRLPAPAA